MKKFFKIIGILFGVIILFVVGWLIYFNMSYPKVSAAKDIHIEATPERIARGTHLVENVVLCIDCHSERDYSKYAGPVKKGTEGKGGELFDESLAQIPGVIYAKNITPSGIGNWTDGELLRTITTGVNKDGVALFPLMPYMNYRNLSQEDLYSIIVYIRTLKPIENKVPERSLNFPMNLIVKSVPQNAPEKFPEIPPKSDSVAYGQYIANAVACDGCHTHRIKGEVPPGMDYAGGFTFCLPDGRCVTSANLTPDNETGIGLLSKEAFLDKFRFYRTEAAQNTAVDAGGNQTAMPWVQLSRMSDEDIGAIYTYLRTLKPVTNKIEKFSKKS